MSSPSAFLLTESDAFVASHNAIYMVVFVFECSIRLAKKLSYMSATINLNHCFRA